MSTICGWKFPVQVGDNGKIATVEDNANIKQSVKMILKTNMFERKVVPEFGTDLRSYVFEVADSNTVSRLRKEVMSSVKRWEEHIADLNVSAKTSGGVVSKIDVGVDYITDIEPTQERVIESID